MGHIMQLKRTKAISGRSSGIAPNHGQRLLTLSRQLVLGGRHHFARAECIWRSYDLFARNVVGVVVEADSRTPTGTGRTDAGGLAI